jgi:hypothetical protein
MLTEFYKRIENDYFYFDDMDIANNKDLETIVSMEDIKRLWVTDRLISEIQERVDMLLYRYSYLDIQTKSDQEKYQMIKDNISFDELQEII